MHREGLGQVAISSILCKVQEIQKLGPTRIYTYFLQPLMNQKSEVLGLTAI